MTQLRRLPHLTHRLQDYLLLFAALGIFLFLTALGSRFTDRDDAVITASTTTSHLEIRTCFSANNPEIATAFQRCDNGLPLPNLTVNIDQSSFITDSKGIASAEFSLEQTPVITFASSSDHPCPTGFRVFHISSWNENGKLLVAVAVKCNPSEKKE